MKSLNFFYGKYIVRELFNRDYSGKGITVKILNREIVRKITIYGKDWNHEKGR